MAVFGGLNYMDFRDKYSTLPQEPTTPYATVEPLDRFVNELPARPRPHRRQAPLRHGP